MQITRSWWDAWKEDAGVAKADAEAPRWRPRWLAGIFWRRSFVSAALPHVVVVLAGLLLFGLDQWVWTWLIPARTT
jgi:hypothetical protein